MIASCMKKLTKKKKKNCYLSSQIIIGFTIMKDVTSIIKTCLCETNIS